MKVLAAGVLAAYDGITVEDFEARSDAFLRTARHPTLDRGYLDCAYAPMVELLDYLATNGFSNYIVSGGGRDFMRPISCSCVNGARFPSRVTVLTRARAPSVT